MLSKQLKKVKGFTLIELMIVIAVIALLMLVLVPRIGVIKNKSREAGIKANLLMVEGIVQSVIDNYDADGTGVDNLESKIAADINAVSVENQKIRNPVTGNTGCGDLATDVGTTAILYSTNDDSDDGADLPSDATTVYWDDPLDGAAGTIGFGAYVDTGSSPNKLCVKLIPYGTDNNRITSLEKVISQ